MTAITTTITAPDARHAFPWAEPVSITPLGGSATRAAWCDYLERAAGATVFHDPVWCDAVERVFGHAPLHRIAWRGGHIVGVLPLVEVCSRLGGKLLVSVPYGTYGGMLCDDDPARDALARDAEQLVHERGARVLDVRSAEAAVPTWERVEHYDAFVRELPAEPDGWDAFLPKRARAAARQAHDRAGVTVVHDAGQLRTVWKLYSRSMRRLGSINYPLRFFEELVRQLGERAWVSVAWAGRRAVAGTLSLVYRDTISPYILGLDERAACPGVANYLYYVIMEEAIRRGLRRFDYGRTRKDNAGSAGFKKNQGFVPRTLGYQRYVPAGVAAPDLTPSNPRFRLARTVWRHLPLALTRGLGAYLARSIPG